MGSPQFSNCEWHQDPLYQSLDVLSLEGVVIKKFKPVKPTRWMISLMPWGLSISPTELKGWTFPAFLLFSAFQNRSIQVTEFTSSTALFCSFLSSPVQPQVKSRGRICLSHTPKPDVFIGDAIFFSVKLPNVIAHAGPASEVQKDLGLPDVLAPPMCPTQH